MILQVHDVHKWFGGLQALSNISFALPEEQILGLIGPNGAGKTTLFNVVNGVYAPNAGQITFLGKNTRGLKPYYLARMGMARTHQIVRPLNDLTVRENVMVGAHSWTHHGFLKAFLRLPENRREEREILEAAEAALERVGLSQAADSLAESLPIGQQRAVQVARALCGRPKLLLLDEPASGLRSAERERLAHLLESLRAEGLSMLLVEHDVAFVARLAGRIVVMDRGRVIAEGSPAEVRRNPLVIGAYLGQERRRVAHA
jgi:branched-chain amino acid transport system ATP-binding protein